MRAVAVLLLASLILAGCMSGGANYPNGLLVQQLDLPDGWELADSSHPFYAEVADDTGIESNPGRFQRDVFGLNGTPEVWLAMWVHGEDYVFSLAYRFNDTADVDDFVQDMGCDSEGATYTNGLHAFSVWGEPTSVAVSAAASIQSRTGGVPAPCPTMFDQAAAQAGIELTEGNNGPFSIDPADDMDWYRLTSGTDVEVYSTGEGDTVLYAYDSSGTLVDQNDDCGSGSADALNSCVFLDAGTYYLVLTSYDMDELIDEYHLVVA